MASDKTSTQRAKTGTNAPIAIPRSLPPSCGVMVLLARWVAESRQMSRQTIEDSAAELSTTAASARPPQLRNDFRLAPAQRSASSARLASVAIRSRCSGG